MFFYVFLPSLTQPVTSELRRFGLGSALKILTVLLATVAKFLSLSGFQFPHL